MLIDVSTGVRLDSVEYGDRGAEPLLLLCDTAHSHVLWTEFAQALAARHRVICYDHRGIGDSQRGQGPLSVALLAEDAAALLDSLGIARAHVLGWSLGSAVAQELVLAHPERVGGLVLWGTWPAADGFQSAMFAALRHPWVSGDVAAGLAALSLAFSREFLDAPEAVARLRASLPAFPHTESQVRTACEQFDADLAHDTRDRLAEVKARTLVLVGERDVITPEWQAEAVAAAIPGARLEVFRGPHSAHAVGLERAAEVVPLVLRFLAEAPLVN
jgi:pimeloyl-ACP methyl ester carboxylesterase